ncbi:hypothetical protein KJ644_02375 [Candidatus Dependentiae bacterium]|nr:hypothetical protein [Candidatus Dependentiae bacterium]MBU4387299.1 hypothetical protein [Candidatus Dependentiae bacterium]MCG2756443.1 hypothetical protein [Candidatus Dependentiae bacterium]
MQSVIVAWCKTNEVDFESFVPLEFLGKRNQQLGYSNNINILFIDGFEKLSQQYKHSLKSLGFILHNVSKIFNEYDKKFFKLNRFGDYEKKCFLRWLVIEKFFNSEPIVHYDGDIVFNENPEIIKNKIENKTFVLQGCPAFTVISNNEWFNIYRSELNKFTNDIDKYSEIAWQNRNNWEITFKTRWAGSRFRKIIWSDQDFLSHLIHTNNIIQDSVEDVLFNFKDYVVFQNPLFLHLYEYEFPYKYVRINGIDYFEFIRKDGQDCFYKKKILFWHMQSHFNYYLSKFIFRKKYLKFIPMGRLEFNTSAIGFEDYVYKKMLRFTKNIERKKVYKYFFEKYDFSRVFRDNIWWRKGIFY